ncbi:MAG: hypothetical protein GY822_19855 [Deltaproteobacteria bacterium]|nr:hypothetical protein [Deltaproteobacteria bacterium]
MSSNTIQDATDWLDSIGKEHLGDTSRLMNTALARLAACREDDEPDEVEWTLANLEILQERFAKAEKGLKPTSLRTYVSRARTAMELYVAWREAPQGWHPEPRVKKKRARRSSASVAAAAPTQVDVDAWSLPKDASLDDEISAALMAMAKWPKLRRYLLEGIAQAQTDAASE